MITIRALEEGDLAEALALETAHQPVPWSEGIFRDELGAENRAYLVAVDEHLIGYGGVMVSGDEAHVTNLLVSPERRGEGIGRRIMLDLIDVSVQLGAHHLTLEVRSGNQPARRLYESLGLVPVGVRTGYYGDDDALIMWAHDIGQPGFVEGLR